MRPTMRVFEMVGRVLVTTPSGVDVGAFRGSAARVVLVGVGAPESRRGRPGSRGRRGWHGDVGGSAGAGVALGVAEDGDRGLGGDAVDLAEDVAVEHEVADDEDA